MSALRKRNRVCSDAAISRGDVAHFIKARKKEATRQARRKPNESSKYTVKLLTQVPRGSKGKEMASGIKRQQASKGGAPKSFGLWSQHEAVKSVADEFGGGETP